LVKGGTSGLVTQPLISGSLLLTGFLTVPVSPLFVGRLISSNGVGYVSGYWFLAGIASFSSVFFLRRSDFVNSRLNIAVTTVACVASFLAAYLVGSAGAAVVAGALYVFGSVALSVSLQKRCVSQLSERTVGAGLGAIDALIDTGIFLGLLFSSLAEGQQSVIAIALVVLMIIRGLSQSSLTLELVPASSVSLK
jgi:hypothetical protein